MTSFIDLTSLLSSLSIPLEPSSKFCSLIFRPSIVFWRLLIVLWRLLIRLDWSLISVTNNINKFLVKKCECCKINPEGTCSPIGLVVIPFFLSCCRHQITIKKFVKKCFFNALIIVLWFCYDKKVLEAFTFKVVSTATKSFRVSL